MPIVTITENDKTTYYAVTEGNECAPWALVKEYKLTSRTDRRYAEHDLREEYLRRLTEHAYECATLAHLVLNPPDDEEDLLGDLKVTDRLAGKVAKDAVWLRTYDPFSGLIAEAVEVEHGTGLRFARALSEDQVVSSLDNNSWPASERALNAVDPLWRDGQARQEKESADAEDARHTPAERKRIKAAAKRFWATVNRDDKPKRTVANKTVRRTKGKAR
jgi:hypothetical protein